MDYRWCWIQACMQAPVELRPTRPIHNRPRVGNQVATPPHSYQGSLDCSYQPPGRGCRSTHVPTGALRGWMRKRQNAAIAAGPVALGNADLRQIVELRSTHTQAEACASLNVPAGV